MGINLLILTELKVIIKVVPTRTTHQRAWSGAEVTSLDT